MYKLTDNEATELGLFLRTLCRMGMLNDAKRISKMPDGQLSILIQSEKLWETVDSDVGAGQSPASSTPRPAVDYSRPASSIFTEKKS